MVFGYTLQINQVLHTSIRKVVCPRLFYHQLIIVIRCNTELMGPDDGDKIVDETHSPKYFIEGYLDVHVLYSLWLVKVLPDTNYL